MELLNPNKPDFSELDPKSREMMEKTIAFFENKGKKKIKEDEHANVWYQDFIDFQQNEQIFANLLTPAKYADDENKDLNKRWDTNRNCYFNEILGFYGLTNYWYTWQVSILGLGPIWMSKNEEIKKKTAQGLKEGGVFAFGLSEKEHGADLYSSEMKLIPQEDGTYIADGEKYYIGNGQTAFFTSNFGKIADADGNILTYPESRKDKSCYVFFVANYLNENYDTIKNVCSTQNYVANYALHNYPITESEILSKGLDAWSSAMNTINVGKYNLGWCSIGICTHAFFEALDHASDRILFNHPVTDFTHIQQFFVESYCRIIAMKTFALRAKDYIRTASSEDRRYLLYTPIVKMKVTMQGEEIMFRLLEIIAAKGFESDTFFEGGIQGILALPRLEGTVHVNMAQIVKFAPKFFFQHKDYPEIPKVTEVKDDAFLFNQGPPSGTMAIQFHDYNKAYEAFDLPNVNIFKEQVDTYREMIMNAAPTMKQADDIDFVLIGGELFTLCAYGQLILENAKIYEMDDDLIEQIFDFMIKDFSKFALKFYLKTITKKKQMEYCMQMIKKPVKDKERFERIRDRIYALKGTYVQKE
ncbi:MAG: acyl-CoA dehydrogenase family protein [Candidatus Hodarchaeota archaeon]